MASESACNVYILILTLLLLFLETFVVGGEVRRELTTRSWDELGVHEGVKRSPLEDDIIIGILDTGIWPESQSFSDKGLGPPPKHWKGICQTNGFNFTCNNKLIGARFYVPDPKDFNLTYLDELSPRSLANDHGTHVASIAAGVPVEGVSMDGLKNGTARGGVPRARIAFYKVCWGYGEQQGCYRIADAIDDAIRDGVDIISMSIGTQIAQDYDEDRKAPAAFRAVRHGVLFSTLVGNGGPDEFTAVNVSPWLLTVANSFTAASEFVTYVMLGNGKRLEGYLMNLDDSKTQKPLVLGWKVTSDTNQTTAVRCNPDYLIPELAKGKILLCQYVDKFEGFEIAGVAGVIVNEGDSINFYKEAYWNTNGTVVPIAAVSGEDFAYLLRYYNNSTSTDRGDHKTATAFIARSIEVGGHSLPHAAWSSSRGPNLIDPTIFKPDVSAPGVNILAAVSGNNSYNALTGTSMACPHATGAAAYVKSFHPTWSPAALKSALITTATPMLKDPVHSLAYGAGQINPVGAADPGLIYDIDPNDYLKYICLWSKFNNTKVLQITRDPNINCSSVTADKNWSLNLPTFSIPYKSEVPFLQVFNRTVTNVGMRNKTTYKAKVAAPKGINIKVFPSILAFDKNQRKLSYTISIGGRLSGNRTVHSAALVWTNGKHHVRSPIAIFPAFDRDTVENRRWNPDVDGNTTAVSSLIPRIM